MTVSEFCRIYGFNGNTIRSMIRADRLKAEKASFRSARGYQWVLVVPEVLEQLKSFHSKPHPSRPKEGEITPETWARFEEVWEDFCSGRCWPTPFGKPKMRGSWLWVLVDPKSATNRTRRNYRRRVA